MTTYLGFDELKTLLNGNVTLVGITIKYEDWLLTNNRDVNTIQMRVDIADADWGSTGDSPSDDIITSFAMRLHFHTKPESDSVLDQIRNIINDAIVNGRMHVDRWFRIKSTEFFIWELQGTETFNDN